jgi:hypothetical protein
VATNSFSRIDMVDWVQKNAPPEDMVACLAIFGKLIDPRTKDADMMLEFILSERKAMIECKEH